MAKKQMSNAERRELRNVLTIMLVQAGRTIPIMDWSVWDNMGFFTTNSNIRRLIKCESTYVAYRFEGREYELFLTDRAMRLIKFG